MVFPNWGAIASNIVNSSNKSKYQLVGDYKPDKEYKNLWWKLLIIAGILLVIDIVLLISII